MAGQGAESRGLVLEDFEDGFRVERWGFSEGPEFPGAKGRFERAENGAAHAGRFGGKLTFDFTGGGNYVAAAVRPPGTVAMGTNGSEGRGLRLWLQRPEGNEVVFRYTDAGGQTLQKPVECPAGRWVRVTIPFSDWTVHWGGANDGKPRGHPTQLALLMEHGAQTTGALVFDDLELVDAVTSVARVAYPVYRFGTEEGWSLRSEGNRGASQLAGRTWTADFSAGARWVSLGVPDHVLLGNVDRLRVRVRVKGNAAGHPVRLVLHTHFMTFQKILGELPGDGEQELVTEGPPGPGWTWSGGENDGQLHGPLRLGEIGLGVGAGTGAAGVTLELRELVVEAVCPPDKRIMLVAANRDPGERPEFVARVRGLTDVPLSGRLQWRVRDWEGHELCKAVQAVTVPAGGAVVEHGLSFNFESKAGIQFLEAEVNLEMKGQETAPALAAWVARSIAAGDAQLEPESPFGMGVYLNRYGGDAGGRAAMERAAQMARDAGVKWTREDFSWGRIEPRRGEFDWSYYDNLVACARRNGITVYAIAGYWTGWTKPYTTEGIDDYVRYLQAMVRRYHGDIRQWEIWNEPNIFFWQGPKDLYAELLKRSYAAIKEIDSGAQVLGLSTAGIDRKFIDRMLELQAPFDILTIHPYRTHLVDRDFIADLKKVSDQVLRPDGQHRPVWLTEMGWATHTPHHTARQDFAATTLRAQAELIARSYLCAIVSGVEPRTFWYDFKNDGEDPIYFEHQMGIVYSDFTPKPAYRAFATLTEVLRGRQLAGPVVTSGAGAGVLAFRFTPRDLSAGETVAMWSPKEDARVSLATEARQVTRVNGMGERSELVVREGRVEVELKAGAPVYLLLP